MKKLLVTAIAICTVCAMAITVSAAALPDISVFNAMENQVTVSGAAAAETFVSLTVLNPDYTESDFASTPQAAIQYFGGTIAGADGYTFNVEITGDGGDYTFIINADGVKSSRPFPFYSAEVKFDSIDDINDAEDDDAIAEIIDDVMETFSLSTNVLYSSNSKAAVSEALEYIKAAQSGEQFGAETAEDLDDMYTFLKEACLIAAYNTDSDDILMSDGSLLYLSDIMNLADTDELADYALIDDDGKAKLTDDLFESSYESVEEIEAAFKELVPFYVLVNYHERGYGHVENYFEKYRDFYEDAGFDLDKFDGKKGKNTIYSKVASSKAASISKLKTEFNKLLSDNGSGGGNGGGNGGGSVPNYSNYGETVKDELPQDTPQTPPVTEVTPDKGFSDTASHWAADPIEALAEAGIISGRGDGSFDPDGTITRAELTKIVVISILGEADETAEITFTDAESHWAKAHIATALKAGIVSGMTDTTFAPDGLITREQAAAIIHRAIKAKSAAAEASAENFDDDASISDWAKDAIYALKGAGIISGRDGNNFCPAENLTRAEAAKLVYTIMNLE